MEKQGKPKVAIVTNHQGGLANFLQDNLREVFGEELVFSQYYFDSLQEGQFISDDVVLVMSKGKAIQIRKYVADTSRIVVVERTLRDREAYRICSVPAGTRVLVVNDLWETTVEMMALLYQLGITHLELIPYEQGKVYADIRIAVTPGETGMVPEYIQNVIDVGHRCLDLSTCMTVMNRLGIQNENVSRRLIAYSERIVLLENGLREQYKSLVMRNVELDTVMNLVAEGIILIGKQGEIMLYNQSLANMLHLQKSIIGQSGAAVLPAGVSELLKKTTVYNELVEIYGRSFVANKREVSFWGEEAGACFHFQEVTYIRQLEQSLHRKLKERGAVARYSFENIQTQAPEMRHCVGLAKKIAGADLTVLITGESGTGKELMAQSIHNASQRGKQPFVAINCAAMPETLLESELFGYEGGAFTGALKEGKAGLFEQANNGTLFLDEVGDMPLLLQIKLLRVLQERQVVRIGSQKVMSVNVRIIAATHQDLNSKVQRGEFRADLYYRLNVLPLVVPALRCRKEDILSLLQYFLNAMGKGELQLDERVRQILLSYSWPGNIRELENVAAYLAYLGGDIITEEVLPHYLVGSPNAFEKEWRLLVQHGDERKVFLLLAVMDEEQREGRSHGRQQLLERIREKGEQAGEGEIRRLLALLAEWRMVEARVGRRGSELIVRGRQFLNWMKNRV